MKITRQILFCLITHYLDKKKNSLIRRIKIRLVSFDLSCRDLLNDAKLIIAIGSFGGWIQHDLVVVVVVRGGGGGREGGVLSQF